MITVVFVLILIIILQVNRIRELPQNSKIVATHTDSPDVSIYLHVALFLLNVDYQDFKVFKSSILSLNKKFINWGSSICIKVLSLWSGPYLGRWGSTKSSCCSGSYKFSSRPGERCANETLFVILFMNVLIRWIFFVFCPISFAPFVS